MRNHWRGIIVGIAAACGVLLVAMGILGLRELLEAGKIPGEMLTRRVHYLTFFTAAALSLGLTTIVWCVFNGIAWARSVQLDAAASEARPSEER
jgi:amino acid transporter